MQKESLQSFTENTYDKAARGYAKKYDDIGIRSADVDKAFSLLDNENPFVVEIGCGGGREAGYILTKTNKYVGFDISSVMLEIAHEHVPEAQFEKANVLNYKFPPNVDIIFAFASLLHSSREELEIIFRRIYEALSDDGVIYVSLKRRSEYSTEIVEGSMVLGNFIIIRETPC